VAFVLPFDHETSTAYARLKAQLRRQGRMPADNDLWIAALAVRHAVPLVSNNRIHFERVPGLILICETPK
jgi:predicted nucleic acid-binding protein